MATPAYYEQNYFRFRDDDDSEAAATWRELLNTDTTYESGDLDVNNRLRIGVAETGGNAGANENVQFQYSHNSGAWTNISTTSSVVKAIATAHFNDLDDTTQQLTSGGFDGSTSCSETGVCGSNALDPPANGFSEVELCYQVISGDVSNADTIDFRVLYDGALDEWNQVPRITISVGDLIQFATSISGGSVTSSAPVNVARSMGSGISAQSLSADIALLVSRQLASSIAAVSDVTAINLDAQRSFASSLNAGTLGSDAILAVKREIASSLAASSGAGDIVLAVSRPLNSIIAAGTLTSDINLNVGDVIQFATAIAALSGTGNISLAVKRPLGSAMAAQTQSGNINLAILRSLNTSIAALSNASNILLAVKRPLGTAIDAQTSTSDIELSISGFVQFASLISATSDVADISLAVDRALNSAIDAQTSISDIELSISGLVQFVSLINASTDISDIDLLVGLLGVIIDPSITSITPVRILESMTPVREIESKTIKRTILPK